MKKIAWGTSKLLWLYLQHTQDRNWAYVIDNFTDKPDFEGLPIRRSSQLEQESFDSYEIYIFAVSNNSICLILAQLASHGLALGKNVHLYSELFAPSFASLVQSQLGWSIDPMLLSFATSATINSRKAVHTTICGSWLFLEAVRNLQNASGDVAEIGCFEGGNALMCLQSPVWCHNKSYYLFDSFEGFPEPSPEDPSTARSGDYTTGKFFGEIVAPFVPYKEVKIVKGFVPRTFTHVPQDQEFSLIFYDCDLYQPALDTFSFFWNRMKTGGLILIHDYFAEPGGFHGVRKATNEFFGSLGAEILPFWQNTMAVVRKA
jgi:hypothetical protein